MPHPPVVRNLKDVEEKFRKAIVLDSCADVNAWMFQNQRNKNFNFLMKRNTLM